MMQKRKKWKEKEKEEMQLLFSSDVLLKKKGPNHAVLTGAFVPVGSLISGASYEKEKRKAKQKSVQMKERMETLCLGSEKQRRLPEESLSKAKEKRRYLKRKRGNNYQPSEKDKKNERMTM